VLASSSLQTSVLTSRIAEAEKFYSDILGLPLIGKSHGALIYDVGAVRRIIAGKEGPLQENTAYFPATVPPSLESKAGRERRKW
jgi:catechol 2,3-dioxygenase-like lactoylglutathione lyase family enzyme